MFAYCHLLWLLSSRFSAHLFVKIVCAGDKRAFNTSLQLSKRHNLSRKPLEKSDSDEGFIDWAQPCSFINHYFSLNLRIFFSLPAYFFRHKFSLIAGKLISFSVISSFSAVQCVRKKSIRTRGEARQHSSTTRLIHYVNINVCSQRKSIGCMEKVNLCWTKNSPL